MWNQSYFLQFTVYMHQETLRSDNNKPALNRNTQEINALSLLALMVAKKDLEILHSVYSKTKKHRS